MEVILQIRHAWEEFMKGNLLAPWSDIAIALDSVTGGSQRCPEVNSMVAELWVGVATGRVVFVARKVAIGANVLNH